MLVKGGPGVKRMHLLLASTVPVNSGIILCMYPANERCYNYQNQCWPTSCIYAAEGRDEAMYVILFYDETQPWYCDHSQTIVLFKWTFIITVTPLPLTESFIRSLEGTWFCVTSSHSLKLLISCCHFWGKQWHWSPIITWSNSLIWHHIANRQQQQEM